MTHDFGMKPATCHLPQDVITWVISVYHQGLLWDYLWLVPGGAGRSFGPREKRKVWFIFVFLFLGPLSVRGSCNCPYFPPHTVPLTGANTRYANERYLPTVFRKSMYVPTHNTSYVRAHCSVLRRNMWALSDPTIILLNTLYYSSVVQRMQYVKPNRITGRGTGILILFIWTQQTSLLYISKLQRKFKRGIYKTGGGWGGVSEEERGRGKHGIHFPLCILADRKSVV